MRCIYNLSTWLPSKTERMTVRIFEKGSSILFTEEYKHTPEFKRGLVRGASAHHVLLQEVPQDLHIFFINLNALDLHDCGLKKIARKELRGLVNLKEISLREMEIEELPDDLFLDLKFLEVIELHKNKIKCIGKNVFRHLNSVNFIDLRENDKIDVIFAAKDYEVDNGASTRLLTLDELNNFIKITFHDNTEAIKNQNANNVWLDVQKILNSDKFRDFTIKIDETELKVHKFILIARSPTIADMIENKPEADNLVLQDIDVDVFKVVLDYIYNDSMPKGDDEKLTKIFASAGKLKLEKLRNFIGAQLCDLIDENNAMEMLKLATKQNYEEFKQKSFQEIKKMFHDKNLKDDLIDDIEKLQKLVDGKKKFDEKIRKAEEEFQSLMSEVE